MNQTYFFDLIAEKLSINAKQVKNTVHLLDESNTVPFIARYRKEVTGSLDEEQIRQVEALIKYMRTLEERKNTVLKSIEEQGKLTDELREKICSAEKLQEVEDLYLPYKPKRRTRASIAKEKGLEPLAELITAQEITQGKPEDYALEYINPEKEVNTAEDALAGACDIVAEMISDNADIRKIIRQAYQAYGNLASETADEKSAREKYESYMQFSEPVKSVPPHRILAINRGEKEGALYAWIDVNESDMINLIDKELIINPESVFTAFYKNTIADSYDRLIMPSLQREVRKMLTERADQHAISVFASNLKSLLMAPPMKDKIIMGIDPGYRTGCKVAVIDKTGKYLEGDTIYPHPPQKQWEKAKNTLESFIKKYDVGIIAIGNGTACRETEQLAAELASQNSMNIYYTIVNEAGASVYSASVTARKEFPNLDASMRGNISIARRLLDPLSELVKIEPKSIGVGLYQHDVDQHLLSESLDNVVESCVNAVGVDMNTASASLLQYVSGINSRVSENIVRYREENGPYTTREFIKKVKGIGENSFIQSAGFLRIPHSDCYFDRTAVHPESYQAAQYLLDKLSLDTEKIRQDSSLLKKAIKNCKKSLSELAEICHCGQETLMDIIEALEKPNLDPRSDMPAPVLRSDVLDINDLYEGMTLKGTVRNVVDFGAFVDIGVKQDGLIHLSQMAKRYIKHPLDVVNVNDVIEVKILKLDKERSRIALSMLLDGN